MISSGGENSRMNFRIWPPFPTPRASSRSGTRHVAKSRQAAAAQYKTAQLSWALSMGPWSNTSLVLRVRVVERTAHKRGNRTRVPGLTILIPLVIPSASAENVRMRASKNKTARAISLLKPLGKGFEAASHCAPYLFAAAMRTAADQAAALGLTITTVTNLPERSRPSDQIHRTAELRRCAVRRSLAWASETVLPSATGLAEPCFLDGPVVLRAPVYRRCIAFVSRRRSCP